VPVSQLLRAYPQYGDLNLNAWPGSSDHYYALQLKAERKMANNLRTPSSRAIPTEASVAARWDKAQASRNAIRGANISSATHDRTRSFRQEIEANAYKSLTGAEPKTYAPR
jgi:hypothetical protein